MKLKHAFGLVVAAAGVVVGSLAFALHNSENHYIRQSGDVRRLRADLRRAETGRTAFASALQSVSLAGSNLRGYDVVHAMPVDMRVTDGIYYTVAPDCPACALNLPTLERLYSTGVVETIVGLSVHGDSELSAYAKLHRVTFPVLGAPAGLLMDLIPRHLTPISILVARGHIAGLFEGRLDSTDISVISQALRAQTGS